ncbi:helix-turn-helix domain-containing protein [Streptomyces sp. NBC_00105]|uniref:helix-turn-helix domain-containing protein n=1 Tax=unclassified Streptomyces TaxID=2593676 RepID=UPI002883AE7F|nr:helix-turn-helix domain-containing protein [Streptomyces sp. DSM 41633]
MLRTPHLIRRADPALFHLALPLHGRPLLTRAGRETVLGAGEMVFYEGSQPFRSVVTGCRDPAELVQIHFPGALLPLPPAGMDRLAGERLSGREGIGPLLTDFLVRLVRDARHYRPADTARLGGILLDLLTALLAHELDTAACVPADSYRRSLMLRVQGFVERHLGDARLSPQAVAAAHQISVSYLYKLFQEEGLTVAAWIRERRLESCRRDLSDPRLDSHPVHVIAARWGFLSNAHFSRAFRAAYGMSPKQYRHTAAPPRGVQEPSTSVLGQSTTC